MLINLTAAELTGEILSQLLNCLFRSDLLISDSALKSASAQITNQILKIFLVQKYQSKITVYVIDLTTILYSNERYCVQNLLVFYQIKTLKISLSNVL